MVARDIAHAKFQVWLAITSLCTMTFLFSSLILFQDLIDAGKPLPKYLADHIVYYAGPAKTPAGYASGSFGPTTAGRMDSYVDGLMKNGGSFITLAKGNRSKVLGYL